MVEGWSRASSRAPVLPRIADKTYHVVIYLERQFFQLDFINARKNRARPTDEDG
jgi:hypothetical protein